MIEKQMIRLMLNKKFYTQYKGTLSPTVFAGDISSLYDTIQKAHDKYEEDIKVDELYSLHTAIFNPALTRAAKEKFSELVEDIIEVQTCLLYTSPSPRDGLLSRMPSSA